jgi:hypothetical protein
VRTYTRSLSGTPLAFHYLKGPYGGLKEDNLATGFSAKKLISVLLSLAALSTALAVGGAEPPRPQCQSPPFQDDVVALVGHPFTLEISRSATPLTRDEGPACTRSLISFSLTYRGPPFAS